MSAIGAALARGLASLGGPGTAAALVAGGLAVGAIGGGLAASRASQATQASSSDQLAVYACPGTGDPLVMVKAGQKLLATGRTEDAAWLRIHFPEPGRTEAWVPASPLQVDGAVASLPVATCAPELAIAPPSIGPTVSLTVPEANPSTATPSPTPTGAPPSATPGVRPSVTGLTASTRQVSYDTGSYCPTAVKRVTFRVKAADVAGIEGVTLYWREPGASSYAQSAMARVAGSGTSGTWQAVLDTSANGITRAGRLAYYAVATDGAGATRRIPTSGAGFVDVAVCANTGPAITSVSSSSGSSLDWDPLSAGGCQTATDIKAVVKDPDGVKSVTLFYRRPGSSSWSSKPMNNTTVPGRWYANLDTLGDRIAIASPPTDVLSWYIKAIDGKNASRQSRTGAITVRRCDTEATFYVNSVSSTQLSFCPPKTTSVRVGWTFSITDPDGLVSATLKYQLVNAASGGRVSQTLTARPTSQRFGMTAAPLDGNTYYGANTVTWTITTKDSYGGTSSAQGKATVNIFVC